jgi:ABC transporter
VSGIDALEGYFGRYLPALVQAALVPALLLAVVLPTDRLSALLMACTIPLIPVFMVLVGRAGEHRTQRQWRTLSLLGAHFLDVVQGVANPEDLRAGPRPAGDDPRRDRRLSARHHGRAADRVPVGAGPGAAGHAQRRLGGGQHRCPAGRRDDDVPGRACRSVAPEVYLPLRQVAARFHASAEGLAAADRIFQVLDAPDPAPATDAPATASDQPGAEIRFEDVSFEYPGRPGAVLERASFVLRAGERVALVGSSGAGKSTVAMLLLGMAYPCGGRITAGGLDLAGADPAAWRARVAWLRACSAPPCSLQASPCRCSAPRSAGPAAGGSPAPGGRSPPRSSSCSRACPSCSPGVGQATGSGGCSPWTQAWSGTSDARPGARAWWMVLPRCCPGWRRWACCSPASRLSAQAGSTGSGSPSSSCSRWPRSRRPRRCPPPSSSSPATWPPPGGWLMLPRVSFLG